TRAPYSALWRYATWSDRRFFQRKAWLGKAMPSRITTSNAAVARCRQLAARPPLETISKWGQHGLTRFRVYFFRRARPPPPPCSARTLASRFCATRCCMPTPDSSAVYQLRIRLDRISPLIWRRLLVRDATTIGELHAIIQIAFGWSDSHLHQF